MPVAGIGFLSKVEAKIREFADEPGTSAKFSDTRILDMMRRAFSDIIDDVNRVSLEKIRGRVDIVVVADQREYALPPYMGQFLEFKKLDDDGHIEWEATARHPLSPWGPGFTIEGPLLRLDPVWKTGHTMRIDFIPTGEAPIYEATADNSTLSTVTSPTPSGTAIAGTVDGHENAYVGYVLRILAPGGVGGVGSGAPRSLQERIIASQDDTGTTPVFTVKPDFSPLPGDQPVFEVVPAYSYRFEDLVALRVARFIAGVTGDKDRWESLNLEYHDSLQKVKLRKATAEGRKGHKMTRRIRGRGRFGKTV